MAGHESLIGDARAPASRPGAQESAGSAAPTAGAPDGREQWAVDTFVELAAILAGDFDLFELLALLSGRCRDLLRAGEAGLLLVGDDRQLHVVASSSEQMHLLELYEVQRAEGPCLTVYESRVAVLGEPLDASTRWPAFAAQAVAAGFRTVHALPMRHDHEIIGVVNLFDRLATSLTARDAAVAQALADIASFAIVQDRALRRTEDTARQLRHALRSRVSIEQAKGVLSEGLQVEPAAAFELLRDYARNRSERIADVASRVVDRSLAAGAVRSGARSRRPPRSAGAGPPAEPREPREE